MKTGKLVFSCVSAFSISTIVWEARQMLQIPALGRQTFRAEKAIFLGITTPFFSLD